MSDKIIIDLSQLTPSRLAAMLGLQQGAVTGIEVVGSHDTGNSISYRLTVQYADPSLLAPSHLFLKIPIQDFTYGQVESDFYRQVVPMMDEASRQMLPISYDAAYDETTGHGHLLMEDLSRTHYTHTELMPLTQYLAETLIVAFADFHSFWWNHPALATTIGKHLTAENIAEFEAKTASVLAQMDYQDHLTDGEYTLLTHLTHHWPEQRKERLVQGKDLTILHRDPHHLNILYPYDENLYGIKIIDWQAWRVDPGTDDLAYLMAFHWSPEHHGTLSMNYLARYHHRLIANGVANYSWADCQNDYRASILRFLCIMVSYWHVPTNRERLKRGLQAAIDWDCESLL